MARHGRLCFAPVAKGRRSRRVKLQPKPGGTGETPARPEEPTEPEDMVSRIDALREDVRKARGESAARNRRPAQAGKAAGGKAEGEADQSPADQSPAEEAEPTESGETGPSAPGSDTESVAPARPTQAGPPPLPPARTGPLGDRPELHPPYPRPGRDRRRGVALGGVAVLIIAGVVIGVLASSSSSPTKRPAIASYMSSHVPAGTPVALVGNVKSALPAEYPPVAISSGNMDSASHLEYAIAPDPVSAAGPSLAAFVTAHGRLVAVDWPTPGLRLNQAG